MLHWLGNNSVQYTLHGIHVTMDILWNWEAAEGGDVYEAVFRGSRARAEIRQGKAEKYVPELYIVPADPANAKDVLQEVRKKVAALQGRWPGLAVSESGGEARLAIPDKFRVGHEAHFAQVSNLFFEYMKSPKSMPARERAEMLAKYFVSTRGVEVGRHGEMTTRTAISLTSCGTVARSSRASRRRRPPGTPSAARASDTRTPSETARARISTK